MDRRRGRSAAGPPGPSRQKGPGLENSEQPTAGKVLALPPVRRLSLTAMTVEFSHQLVLALWIGSLVAIASLAIPSLLDAEAGSQPVRTALDLLGRLSLVGCGAGSFLLLTTMLMHLLSLRGPRTVLLQIGLLLVMTLAAVALQVWLAPTLATILRTTPDLLEGEVVTPQLVRFRGLFGLYLGCLLGQAALGSVLLLTGVRRWYRYIRISSLAPEPLQLDWHDRR
jgi:hypothetical protein